MTLNTMGFRVWWVVVQVWGVCVGHGAHTLPVLEKKIGHVGRTGYETYF